MSKHIKLDNLSKLPAGTLYQLGVNENDDAYAVVYVFERPHLGPLRFVVKGQENEKETGNKVSGESPKTDWDSVLLASIVSDILV